MPIHPITRASASCDCCGLPTLACLCGLIRPIETSSRFLLLTSRKETARASNTGRQLRLLNPARTEIRIWARAQPPPAQLMPPANAWLVYPPEGESAGPAADPVSIGPAPVFVLLDGTWQEAGKMIRKSAYLRALPRLALRAGTASGYALRAGRRAGTLCTIEAAIACLRLVGEADSAAAIAQGFELFQAHYLAGLSGHAPK